MPTRTPKSVRRRSRGGKAPVRAQPAAPGAVISRYLRPFLATFEGGAVSFADETLSDTEVVLIAASIVEQLLRIVIITTFRVSLSDTGLARIFENNGPLSTFNAKILLASALYVLTDATRHDLEIIKSIRNRF